MLFVNLIVYLFYYLFIDLLIHLFLFMLTEDRLLRGSNSSLSSCSSITSEQRTSFFIGQEIAEDSEMAPSSSFTRYMTYTCIETLYCETKTSSKWWEFEVADNK